MVDSLINPLLQYKMPLFDRTVSSAGLSKPKTMSDYLDKQPAQYSEAFFPFDPREKEGSQFASPWNSSKASLLDGRSSTSRLSGMEGKQHMLFRQNGNSSKERAPQLSPLHATPVKQGFRLYSKSPGVSGSTAAPSVVAGQPRSGGDDASVQPGSPVYLAVPKPVYGHTPCCGELCFGRGQYCAESGFSRVPHPVYKHNWMRSDARYGDGAAVQKAAREPLLQRRALPSEAGAEPLRRTETFGPGRVRPLPPIVNPNYSGYPCAFFGSFGEPRQQSSPGAYPNLFPSHHAYEHMTSEVYQEHSPMTKYGHVTQRPVFYYSQADMEVENKSRCKNSGSKPREESPATVKHALPPPQEHFLLPRPLHGQAALPQFQHRALLPGFAYPCYGAPRFNVDARQSLHPSLVLPSNAVHFPPANLCPDYHMASATSLHEDGSGLGAGRSDANVSFVRVEQSHPPRRSDQPAVPSPGVTVNRLFHPSGSPNQPGGVQMAGLNVERFLPYFPSGGQVSCPQLASIHPRSLGCELQPPLHHHPDQISKASHLSTVQTNPSSFSVKTESAPDEAAPSFPSCLKRSPPANIKEERDWEEDEPLRKWKKMEGMETAWLRGATESPPMPIIDNVFSLAPYRAHAQLSGALLPGRSLHSTVRPENAAVQPQPAVTVKRKDQGENQPLDCGVSKEELAGSPAQTSAETRKPQDIKVEKEAPDEFAADSGDRQGPPTWVGGEHSNEAGASLALPKRCKREEPERRPSAVQNQTPDGSGLGDSAVQAKQPPQGNAEVTCQIKPRVPSPPAEHRVSFKNILPCCLKLSTYNIVPPNAKCISPAPAPEKPSASPTTRDVPNPDVQLPVRKHFYELHHSLYKLISKSVFATSEQELRTLLCQLELVEIAYPSCKIKNVSSLLGVKPRELWFKEEVKAVFHELLKRLKEYTSQERCPFPHVMRTSTVFLPMLVLKELLFPMVQSSFIDQVLQEHRVQLRPTTLSEEKILLQLHKRACSSRLRKLMSLKHLPDIYADMVNILYYTCISKHLGLNRHVSGVKDEVLEVTIGRSPDSPSEVSSSTPLKKQKGEPFLMHSKAKSRIKRLSRRLFLDESLTDEENAFETNARGADDVSGQEPGGIGAAGYSCTRAEQDAPAGVTPENSWMRPLNFEDLSPSDATKAAAGAKNHSSVILKLRRMFSAGLNRKKARYQAVLDSRMLADRPPSQTEDAESSRRTAKLTHRWQRTQSFCHALGPVSRSSKRPLLKIKYCPYLSACYGAERRRRWVLRSAVQRAQSVHFPDLVGKRIHHLYEEDDKSEVWYRGEVLRVHEAHANPLKTIFEVRYDSEPEWRYYLELLIDYKKGWLKIED